MKLVADENLDQSIINFLTKNGFEVFSIAKSFSGASDREVLIKTSELNGILLTEDKDFGEIIFSYNIESLSVILLRYQKMELDSIEKKYFKSFTND